MPADPYEQLDLARKITSLAIASRASKLEAEVERLRAKLQDKDRDVFDLLERLSIAQSSLHDSDSRLKLTLEDNIKLAKEKDMLPMTVKKLGRDLAKLETFKMQLMLSLNDDASSMIGRMAMGVGILSVAPPMQPRRLMKKLKDSTGSDFLLLRISHLVLPQLQLQN